MASGMMQTEDNAKGPLLGGLIVLMIFFGGIVGWASMAPLAGAVIADGQLTVEGERKTVQHLDGGVIDEILVQDGDVVAAGQPLVRLDITEAQAQRATLTAERDALAARAGRLTAERDGAEQPSYAGLQERGGSSLDAAIDSQNVLFAARKAEHEAKIGMLDGARLRLTSRLGAIIVESNTVDQQLDLLKENVEASRSLAAKGLLASAKLREIERDLLEVSGRREILRAQYDEAKAERDEVDLRLAETETERLAAISEELATANARLAEIEPTLQAAEKKIARSELRAPVAGQVVGLSVATIGGVIDAGATVLEIVPSGAPLMARARLAPTDRERLSDGAKAEVRLLGVSRQRDATIDGTVIAISADRLASEIEGEESAYEVLVTLDERPETLRLAPGMPVTAIVATTPRTVLQYLISPLSESIARSMREE